MQRQTPNQKVFLLFLEFEKKVGTKITHSNINKAIQYVLNYYNANDSDIPIQSELRELVSRYMQIPPGIRTRGVINSTYGRALADFKKPKALTEAEKEAVQKKKEEKQKFFADLKTSAEQTDRQKQQDLTMAKAGEVERRTRETEELRQETVAASFGYGRPAPRPPYFVNPPDDEKLNDECFLCQESLSSSLPVAFCRYCHSVVHLSCYNEMTPEQRKSLFTKQGLCRICKNGLKEKDVKIMEQRCSVDDPTYFRWPPEAVVNLVSPADKAAAERMLRQQQEGEYAKTLAKDFVLPVLSDEELQEAGVARLQQEEQQKILDEDEMRRIRLDALEKYKKHADNDKAAEMEMRARAAVPLLPSLQRLPLVPVPAAALTDEDIDHMFLNTLPDNLYPSSSSRFHQAQGSRQQPTDFGFGFRALDFEESEKALNEIRQRRQRKEDEQKKKGGKQNKYTKKKYKKRHSKKRHSKKRHSKKQSKSKSMK